MKSRGLSSANWLVVWTILLSGCASKSPVELIKKPSSLFSLGNSQSNQPAARDRNSHDPEPLLQSGKDDPVSLRNQPQQLNADIFLQTAKIFERRGQTEAARIQYEKALSVEPQHEKTLLGYARLQDRMGNPTKAIGLYQKALRHHPQSAVAWNDLGMLNARLGNSTAALDAFSRAISLRPRHALYRNNIAQLLLQSGRSGEAFGHLATVYPEATAHYNIGYLLYQQNRPEEARQAFAMARRMNPQLAPAQQMLTQVEGQLRIAQQPPQGERWFAETPDSGNRIASPQMLPSIKSAYPLRY